MRVLLFWSILCVAFAACKNTEHEFPFDNPTPEEKKNYLECIRIHDEVMPLMGELEDLRSQLQEKKGDNVTNISLEETKRINAALSGLNKSEIIMFNWMARFKELEEIDRNEVPSYLDSMKRRAEEMVQLFDDSFIKAKEELDR